MAMRMRTGALQAATLLLLMIPAYVQADDGEEKAQDPHDDPNQFDGNEKTKDAIPSCLTRCDAGSDNAVRRGNWCSFMCIPLCRVIDGLIHRSLIFPNSGITLARILPIKDNSIATIIAVYPETSGRIRAHS